MCNLCGDARHVVGNGEPTTFADTFPLPATTPATGVFETQPAITLADDRSDASAVGVGASGSNYIDGLLRGLGWDGAFTYSFPQASTDYQAGYSGESTTNFAPVTFQQREATRAALNGETLAGTANVMRATSSRFIHCDVG